MGDFGVKKDADDIARLRKVQRLHELQARRIQVQIAVKELERQVAKNEEELEKIDASIAEIENELEPTED